MLGVCLKSENIKDNISFATPGEVQQIKEFADWNCGINNTVNSNSYIQEFKIPEVCSVPISIGYDEKDNKAWFVGTRNGTLFEYNPAYNNFSSYEIPNWYSRILPAGTSWSWDLKFDKSYNNIWFTDEKLDSIWKFNKSSKHFEQFKVPFKPNSYATSYPISFELTDDENIYFVGIRSLSLWHGNIKEMKNGTSEGIEEIPIPFDNLFRAIPDYEVGLGSLVFDQKNQNIWITALAFEKKGALVKYNIPEKKFSIYEMPNSIKSPTGISIDPEGNLWITDHATSSFYKLTPPANHTSIDYGEIEHIVTSPLSSRIVGFNIDDMSNKTGNLYQSTLPYWIKATDENSVFTNEHVGNKIAKYSPNDNTLVEYWIPSQNVLYSICNPQIMIDNCGYSNALQFAIQHTAGSNAIKNYSGIWFTEQSENKIGFLNLQKKLPIKIDVNPTKVNFHQGIDKSIKIDLNVKVNLSALNGGLNNHIQKDSKLILKPIISTTFNSVGNLSGFNSVAKPKISVTDYYYPRNNLNQKFLTFMIELEPQKTITPGTFNLMVGVESKDFTVLKKVPINIFD